MQKSSTALTELQTSLHKCRNAFAYAAGFSLCINLLTVLTSIYSMQVLDRVFSSHSYETLAMLSLLMVVVILFLGFFNMIRALVLNRTGAWLDDTLSPLLMKRAIQTANSSASQGQRDLGSIRQFITGQGVTTLFDAPWTIVYLMVIFLISIPLGWLCLAGCIILMAFGVVNELATKKTLDEAQAANLRMLAFSDSSARHSETIEAMGMADAMMVRWKKPFAQAQELQDKAGSRGALVQSITKIVRMLLQIAITGIGAYLALERQLTSGGMIAASILSARAFAPFENAIGFWKQTVTARDAFKRLNISMSSYTSKRGEISLPEPRGLLSVEQLSYQASPGTRPILRNINFTLPSGESLGIIGASGAGKSTLSKLLTGIVPPSVGAVRMDGYDLSTWKRSEIGAHIGYVPQSSELFAGTIAENISRMEEGASPEQIIEAAMIAGVHELIQTLPLGYDTPWSASQPTLSPGQKQRVALARAIYGNPKLVILDEPNLNLDGEGEAALVSMLHQLKLRRVTVVMVAHKPSLIQCMDKVLALREGMMEQFGTREQVLQAYMRPAVQGV